MGKKEGNGQAQEAVSDVGTESPEQAQATQEAAPTVATDKSTVDEATAASVETPEEVEQLIRDFQQTKDQLLRQAAEYQNYRRRTEKERSEWIRRGQIQVIEPLLNVLDDFRRSLDASQQVEEQETPGPAYQALRDGVELVYQNLSDTLKKMGVETIEAVGQPFDEHLHEAMMQMPAPEGTAPGVVLQEIQRGYRLGDRVLRHSRVIVAA